MLAAIADCVARTVLTTPEPSRKNTARVSVMVATGFASVNLSAAIRSSGNAVAQACGLAGSVPITCDPASAAVTCARDLGLSRIGSSTDWLASRVAGPPTRSTVSVPFSPTFRENSPT